MIRAALDYVQSWWLVAKTVASHFVRNRGDYAMALHDTWIEIGDEAIDPMWDQWEKTTGLSIDGCQIVSEYCERVAPLSKFTVADWEEAFTDAFMLGFTPRWVVAQDPERWIVLAGQEVTPRQTVREFAMVVNQFGATIKPHPMAGCVEPHPLEPRA